MIEILPQNASRYTYGAAVMAAHLRSVVQRNATHPDDLRAGVLIAVQQWFANALRALHQKTPHMEERMLVLLRTIISRSIIPPPHNDDTLYDRLRAYAHILDILDTRRALMDTEQRDARELVTCLEALRNAGENAAYSEHMAKAHADLDSLASQTQERSST